MSRSLMKMNSRISAQMVMMGMENEQTIPISTPPELQADGVALRSLCSGQGRTDMIRSTKPRLRIALTCPQRTSDITKAVFLSYLRKPAGVVSAGSGIRMGRAGASESKNDASWNDAD